MAIEADPKYENGDADVAFFDAQPTVDIVPDDTYYERVFGPKNLHRIPLAAINVVSQMRTLYEDEPLEELAESIDMHGLMHQLTVIHLPTPEEAQTYLDGINRIWDSNHTLEELTPLETGGFIIAVAGHRRYFALHRIAALHEYDPAEVGVVCNVYEDMITYEALKRQMSENVMAPPQPYEFAYAIRELYETGLAERKFTSIAGFAKEMPYGEDKIRSAIRFCMIPSNVRELVEQGHMPYTVSLELVPLIQFYLEQEEHHEIIAEKIYNLAIKALLNNWGKPKLNETVSQTIEDLRVTQLGLELLEDGQNRSYEEQLQALRNERRRIIAEFSSTSIAKFNVLLAVHDSGIAGLSEEVPVLLENPQVKEQLRRWSVLVKRLLHTDGLADEEVAATVKEVDAFLGLQPTDQLFN